MNGASKQAVIVPSGSAKDANVFAISYSFGLNHWAVTLLGNPALSPMEIVVITIPNNATG